MYIKHLYMKTPMEEPLKSHLLNYTNLHVLYYHITLYDINTDLTELNQLQTNMRATQINIFKDANINTMLKTTWQPILLKMQ